MPKNFLLTEWYDMMDGWVTKMLMLMAERLSRMAGSWISKKTRVGTGTRGVGRMGKQLLGNRMTQWRHPSD